METMQKRIYYHDTDCGGVVYYANYLKYFEEARTEYMHAKGFRLKELAERGVLFVVRRVQIDYKAPAHYADVLEIYTQIAKTKNVSLDFFQEIKRADKTLVSATTTLVCVDSTFRPAAMPQELIDSMSR